ncbi:hypothetical protein GCM10027566_00410 [Arachidicoccus ginsenosidivorans]
MKIFHSIIILTLSLVATLPVRSQNSSLPKHYFVAKTGSDQADGSKAHPFKTISAAASKAMPGDDITVHAGVYREQITPPRGGNSATERIVYQAAKGEKVVIKGSEKIKGWEKIAGDTWVVRIPNSFFGKFNPYSDLIKGDWYTPPKGANFHTGAVYLNGDWLMEAIDQEDVMGPAKPNDPRWYGVVDSTTTTIWAQFIGVDPNKENVEINVRKTVFYPDKPFINFITVKGFTMEQAATNWAPPTAEQEGLIGTHWSRGWIIEDNNISYSKCVGIALGKYGDSHDNKQTESAVGYVGTINRALAFGWNKGTIGSHLVQNNTVSHCEQTGIVGSMGCSFSVIKNNIIHDIHVKQLFGGAEMAGIKFHGAIDVQITGNKIYRTNMGVWLDWMAQGAQIKGNLFYDNLGPDIFLEVDHGPMLICNNILLSKNNLLMNSSGAAFAHNLFAGGVQVISYDARKTPYMLPHSTYVVGLHDNPGGDVQFINNLFTKGANVSAYKKAILPVIFKGNVYTKGAIRAVSGSADKQRSYGEISKEAKEKLNKAQDQLAKETDFLVAGQFDAAPQLIAKQAQAGKVQYLKINLDKQWLEQRRQTVTTKRLHNAIVPNLPFVNPDGSYLQLDTDYLGNKRNQQNPSPGPFEITKTGEQQIRF